jgi:hypothetical protein
MLNTATANYDSEVRTMRLQRGGIGKKDQGKAYNQPRQEHANNGMILSLGLGGVTIQNTYIITISFMRGLIGLLTYQEFRIHFEGLLAFNICILTFT